jgi:alanyl aminopeptidase
MGERAEKAEWASRLATGSKGDADELVLTVPHEVSGDVTLDVAYDADFSEGLNGLYRVDEGGHAYAFTQFEPFGARLAFPCFDEPSAKVPFELTITAPKGNVALSNMPVKKESPGNDGTTVFEFEKSPPLPTYLVALAVGPLEIREGSGGSVPLRLAAVTGRSALGQLALDTAKDHLHVLEAYFGIKYPYPKLDLVAVPNFAAGAMENAGLVTFREERLLVDPRTAPTALVRAANGVIAHELAHMWFGDLVTMYWWDDIWLNEGFATWMSSKVLDRWHPEMRAGVEALGGTFHAMHADTLDSARKVRQSVRSTTEALEAFDGITYQKGAALLEMTESWLGEDTFRDGLVRYLNEHRFANARSEDLFSALQAQSGKAVPPVLKSFTEQTGVPLVEFGECKVDAGAASVALRQREFRPLGSAPGAPAKSWTFPVCVHQSGQKGGPACTLLESGEATLVIPGGKCPPWFYPNANQSGYYHAKVRPEALVQLAALPRGQLADRERVGILNDAWALVESGDLDVSAFVDLARRFKGDPEPAVWDVIVSGLDFIDDEIVEGESQNAFAAAVRRLLAPEVAALGWEERPKDADGDKMRRRLVLSAQGAIGRDPKVIEQARKIALAWLSDPRSVHGDQAIVALHLAAKNGDDQLMDKVVERIKAASSPEERVLAVGALGAFRSRAQVKRALDLLLDGTIRTQDQFYVLRSLFADRKVRDVAFQSISDRLDAFLDKIPPFNRRRVIPLMARSCGEEEVQRVRALLSPKLAGLEGADRGFAQAIEEGARCGGFRAHHAPLIDKWTGSARH